MKLIDVFILAFLGIYGIIGLKDGLVKSLFKLLGGVASVFIAYFLCERGAEMLGALKIGGNTFIDFLSTNIQEKIESISVDGNSTFFTVVPTAGYNIDNVTIGLKAVGIPDFLVGIVAPLVLSVASKESGVALSICVAHVVSNLILTVITYLLLFVLVSVLLGIINDLLTKIFKLPILGAVNRIAGVIFGAGKAIIIIWVILFVISLVAIVSDVATKLIADTTVLKFLSDNNLIAKFVSEHVDFDAIVERIVG